MLTGSKGLFCISTLFLSFVLSVYCQKIRKSKLKMSIVHKSFRDKRALSPASILEDNLISLKSAIPYDATH